jgi:hypothetical protein
VSALTPMLNFRAARDSFMRNPLVNVRNNTAATKSLPRKSSGIRVAH